MKEPLLQDPSGLIKAISSRRQILRNAAAGGLALAAGAILPGCGGSGNNNNNSGGNTQSAGDVGVLDFALNLEYLEAEYYLRGVTGSGLTSTDNGGQSSNVTGGRKVTFSTAAYANIAAEIAADELAHVRALRATITGAGQTPVVEPKIDLTNSFNTLAKAAGLGNTFDPFANEVNFLLGAFIFEDVGVTAYHGAAGLIGNSSILSAAAGILGTEAYHAGSIRTLIYLQGGTAVTIANAISATRAALGGGKDQGVVLSGKSNIVPADANAITFARTTTEVLNIVYGNTSTTPGLFFPNGLNGVVK